MRLPARIMRLVRPVTVVVALLASVAAAPVAAGRSTLSLDGRWRIVDGSDPDRVPTAFGHTVAVPGLVHSATPGFPGVDRYTTKQLLSSLVYYGRYRQADYDKLGDVRGVTDQARRYFWYEKEFRAPARHASAILKVGKAQFGTAVYLNGVKVGEHLPCFTAGYFDLTRAIHWNGPNRLVVRVGAHPGVLPDAVQCGTDFEKSRWTPGIYDDVSIAFADNPLIVSTQVAPRLAAAGRSSGILIETVLRNTSGQTLVTPLSQQVREWRSGAAVGAPVDRAVTIAGGATATVRQFVPIVDAHLWSPDDPFLYTVATRTSGDDVATRFGMREFHFDTTTRLAYLNGKPIFMRGSNIALHRFFGDPQSGTLPWDDKWVHRLLVDIPKRMHWNAFRVTIGPVPDRWLDLADENGLLIQNEYGVWVGSPVYTKWRTTYDDRQMVGEYAEWMRDGWNHPSVVIWDATNESWLPSFANDVLPKVRGLDLSNRPWENSYNEPGGGDDPVEDHHYFTEALQEGFDASAGGRPFAFSDLEWMDGQVSNPFTKSAHAKILNEYSWLWLNRDGSPTILTDKIYPKLLGTNNTTENRRDLYARMLAGETELWRAYRRYAGVLYFNYLTESSPNAFTSDNFIDIRTLKLEPHFEAAMEQAMKPLGVYLNYWHSEAVAGNQGSYGVFMVNDEGRPQSGTLRLEFVDTRGRVVASVTRTFSVAAYGAQNYNLALAAPAAAGKYELRAIAAPADAPADPTVSRRDVVLKPAAAPR